ncbi:hypothetical protein Tco_0757314 [Tanacetum coccineum]
MSIANQQTLAESGAEGRPLILEKGSYVPWASQFLRFLDNKRGEGELIRNSIDNGPYIRKEIVDLKDDTKKILKPIKDISVEYKNQYYADIKFVAEAGESLTSVYERFSTLINNMDWNEVKPKDIAIDTKLLNSLQLEWSKYVTLTRQKYILETEHFDELYDYLSQFELHVNASKEKKDARNHDPLALVANSYANPSHSHASPSYSCSPPPYYVIHPLFVQDYDDDDYGRVDIQSRNARYAGNGNMNVGRTNRNQSANAGKGLVQKIKENEENVQRIPRTASTPGKTNV